jgi:hypothetical protein
MAKPTLRIARYIQIQSFSLLAEASGETEEAANIGMEMFANSQQTNLLP